MVWKDTVRASFLSQVTSDLSLKRCGKVGQGELIEGKESKEREGHEDSWKGWECTVSQGITEAQLKDRACEKGGCRVQTGLNDTEVEWYEP